MDATWIVASIAIVAICARAFRSWLRFQATQRQLGTSTHDLEREVASLRQTNETVLERLQNLEAIVVSQTWDAVHAPGLSPVERELKVASAVRREVKSDPAAANRQRAEQLAQRLQG
jgi:hypothetical protein